ncbi:MAG: hypothetical protein H0V10_00705 [Geodermatophilaceae bacterium]|nr:hypothetical protein [Geodermatophilaceae bacterium]
MTTMTIQIAVLDAAAESLAAVADTISMAGTESVAAIRTMSAALPGAAIATTLGTVPVEQLTGVVSAQCRQIAQRVAAGAQVYRDLEATLLNGMIAARGAERVPR